MNENYVNTTRTFELYVYDDGSRVSADATPTASAIDIDTDSSVTLTQVNAITHTDGYDYYEVSLDPSEVTKSRRILLTWSFVYDGDNFTNTETIHIVRPYFDADDLWSHEPSLAPDGADPKTVDEIQRVESIVRSLINAYCKQEFQDFGKQIKTYIGNGSNTLQLEDRLYKLYSVDSPQINLFKRENDDSISNEIVTWRSGLPYVIQKKNKATQAFADIKADISPGLLQPRKIFESGVPYDVEADFGWKYLPNEVQQAALILADDYFDEDDIYHRKNITVLRSADYRMEFGADHHTTTGNVHADQLLSNYISTEMAII